MFTNSSEPLPVRLEDMVEVVVAFEGRREGWRLRIGMTGTGGVGRSFEDRLRAAISSSSNTVASVRVLTGLKCSSVTFCRGCFANLAGAGQPSSSALMARPICDIGTEAVLFEVPTPGLTTVRPVPALDICSVLKGDGVTRRGYLGALREATGGGGPIEKRPEGADESSVETQCEKRASCCLRRSSSFSFTYEIFRSLRRLKNTLNAINPIAMMNAATAATESPAICAGDILGRSSFEAGAAIAVDVDEGDDVADAGCETESTKAD